MSYIYYAADQMARDIIRERRSEGKRERKWAQAVKFARQKARDRKSRG